MRFRIREIKAEPGVGLDKTLVDTNGEEVSDRLSLGTAKAP